MRDLNPKAASAIWSLFSVLAESNLNILVTGSSGYIGTELVRQLRAEGYRVCPCDLRRAKTTEENDFQSLDITRPATMKSLQSIHWHAIFHLAALCRVDESLRQKQRYYATNVLGTKNLLQYLSYDKFIYTSSIAANNPEESPYAQTKWEGERLVNRLAPKERGVNFRLANVVGYNGFEYANNPEALFAKLVSVKHGGTFRVHGDDYANTPDGSCLRSFVHIYDVVRTLIASLQTTAKTPDLTEISYGSSHTVLEFVQIFKKVNKARFTVEIGGRRSGDVELIPVQSVSAEIISKKFQTIENLVSIN